MSSVSVSAWGPNDPNDKNADPDGDGYRADSKDPYPLRFDGGWFYSRGGARAGNPSGWDFPATDVRNQSNNGQGMGTGNGQGQGIGQWVGNGVGHGQGIGTPWFDTHEVVDQDHDGLLEIPEVL